VTGISVQQQQQQVDRRVVRCYACPVLRCGAVVTGKNALAFRTVVLTFDGRQHVVLSDYQLS